MIDPHAGQPIAVEGKPLGECAAVMIMIHGRNAGPQGILSLCPALDRPDFTYLAPSAVNGTWYPHSFMAERSSNEPFLTSALALLERVVTEVEDKGIRREHLLLLGFSQGACLASEFAVEHASRFGGLLAFSGGLIGAPGTKWEYPGSFDDTPVFLGCSDVDAHVPKTRVDESAQVFTHMGANVTKRIYPGMGHSVSADEIRFAQQLMDSVLAATHS
jgi:predicted esterase